MISTRKKKQSNKKLLSQLDDFDHEIFIGNAASERQENIVVDEGSSDQYFTVGTSSDSLATTEIKMKVKTLEKCFNEKAHKELSINVHSVEDRIQNAILAAIDSIVAANIDLAVKSKNASSGQDATNATTNSERGEQIGINALLRMHLETTTYYWYQMWMMRLEITFQTN